MPGPPVNAVVIICSPSRCSRGAPGLMCRPISICIYYHAYGESEVIYAYRMADGTSAPAPAKGQNMITTDAQLKDGTEPGTQFGLDEGKARAFLARSLRRHAGDLGDGDGDGAGQSESWTLEPGWDPMKIYCDEAAGVENLVYQALPEAGAVTRRAGRVDV